MENEFFESLQILARTYHKILKVNLTKDTYIAIKVDDNEKSADTGFAEKFSQWLKDFADSGQIFSEDLNIYKTEANLSFLQNYFKNNDENFRLKYRRKSNGEFRWVLLEMLKDQDYKDENQVIMLYVKDIHDSYIKELENQRELEILCNNDMLTGLNNYYAYKKISLLFSQQAVKDSVGVIFADLNGLKIINDMEGHSAGDKFICSFAETLKADFGSSYSYRISGDEFLVIMTGLQKREFLSRKNVLSNRLEKEEIPPASIGWCWQKNPERLEDVVKEAEYGMYDSKHEFYKKHPEYKRSIVEENYKKDVSAIIRKLAFSFGTLGVLDLKKDHYTLLKDEDLRGFFLPSGVYSTFFKRFYTTYVSESSKLTAEKLLVLSNLKEILKTEDSLSCVLQITNGKWLQVTVNKTTVDKNGNPEKVVFFTSYADKDRAKRLNESKQIMDEYKVIDILSRDYMFVSLINSKTGEVRIFKNFGLPEKIINLCSRGKYEEATKCFAEEFILEKDRAHFLESANIERLSKEFENRNEVNFIYKAHSNDEIKQTYYCEGSFIKFNKTGEEIIYAVKDITGLVELEQISLKSLNSAVKNIENIQYL